MNYREIQGDLVELALQGEFDIIAHGCNCFCRMRNGIAPQIAKAFSTAELQDNYTIPGDINKLGTYTQTKENGVYVINCYSQFKWNKNGKPLDYEALTLCLRKINYNFIGKHIGLPQIGCGLAGGDWNIVKSIIQEELKDCIVTVVIYNK